MDRRIVIVRHARAADASAGEQPGDEDSMRPLTPAGRADARALGEVLADQLLLPAQAYVSSALRARETWSALHDGSMAMPDASAEICDALYGADVSTALEIIAGAPSSARTALVLFHNPGAAELIWHLHDGADSPAWQQISAQGVPPCTAVSFAFDGEWPDLAGPMAARLVWAWAPSGR